MVELLLALLLSLSLSAALTATAASRPNLLLLLEDDGGYNGVGYMNAKLYPNAARLHTPVLDALAAEGVKLTSFYVQP